MKRPLILTALLVALPVPALAKQRKYPPGCNTKKCSDRIGARWAARHRPKAQAAVASWYGPGLYGNKTACGQVLTPKSFGVAHKTLPCGTRLRLCVRRCVVAPVIDRGSYVGGRTFDLTAPVRDAIGAGSLTTVRFSVVG